MSEPQPPPKPSPDKSAGPYDFAMFIAQSFGKALPFVVIVALIGYGALVGLREISVLQKSLIEAEREKSEALIAKATAEVDAKAAADKERLKALKEYSQQLNRFTNESAEISEKIQSLVSKQVDNLEKSVAQQDELNNKNREYLQELENRAEQELASLKRQIEEAERKAQEQAREASLSSYNNITETIQLELSKDYVIEESVLDLFLRNMDNQDSLTEAIRDMEDSTSSWEMRTLIALQLFRKTSSQSYADLARNMIEANKGQIAESVLGLFSGYDTYTIQQQRILLPIVLGLILDETLDSRTRRSLFDSPIVTEGNQLPSVISSLSSDSIETERLTSVFINFVGRLLVEIAQEEDSFCFEVQSILKLLDDFPESDWIDYRARALENSRGYENEQECIKEALTGNSAEEF